MYKKALSLLLALCLLLVPVSGVAHGLEPAPASPPPLYITPEPYSQGASFFSARTVWQDGTFRNGVYQGYYAQLTPTQQVIYDLLLKAFSKPVHSGVIKFPQGITPYFAYDATGRWNKLHEWIDENVDPAWWAVIFDHAEISWMLGSYMIDWEKWEWDYDSGNKVNRGAWLTGLNFYVTHPWCTKEMFGDAQLLARAADAAVQAIGQPGSSRAVTVKAIHDFVCNRIEYKERKATVAGIGPSTAKRDVYYDQQAFSGLLPPYQAVCSGYTFAFKLLCDRYGIPCVRVTGYTEGGSDEGHAWNYVQLEDGKWYAVDTTWDDDPLSYGYFLIGSGTTTPRGMPFSRDHIVELENVNAIPTLEETAYPYLEADILSVPSHVPYGGSLTVQAANIRDIRQVPVSEGTAELWEAGGKTPLAIAPVTGGTVALTYDTAGRRLGTGERHLYIRYRGDKNNNAILGSFTFTLEPRALTARAEWTGKDYDGDPRFTGVALALDGVLPQDLGGVSAAADGQAGSAAAGEWQFAADSVTMSGPYGGFYQVTGPVTGQVTIRKTAPTIHVRAFPAIQNPGKPVTVKVWLENPEGKLLPMAPEFQLTAGQQALQLTPTKTAGVYTAAYTLPAGSKAGESVLFSTSISGAENYIDCLPEDSPSALVKASARNAAVFTDTVSGAWYEEGVSFVYNYGLMSGTSSKKFSPNSTTSRGMIATILYRMAGSPAVGGQSRFLDVPKGKWYSTSVVWAAGRGIVGGYPNGKFGPNDPITREQFALMLYRFAGSPDPGADLRGYKDWNSVSSYARKAMRWAVNKGILSGRGGLLDPQGKATRAQSALMIMRYYEKVLG